MTGPARPFMGNERGPCVLGGKDHGTEAIESDFIVVRPSSVEKEYLSPLSPCCPHISRKQPQIVHRVATVTVTVCNMIRNTGNTRKHSMFWFLQPRKQIGVKTVMIAPHWLRAWLVGSDPHILSGSSATNDSEAVSEKLWREQTVGGFENRPGIGVRILGIYQVDKGISLRTLRFMTTVKKAVLVPLEWSEAYIAPFVRTDTCQKSPSVTGPPDEQA